MEHFQKVYSAGTCHFGLSNISLFIHGVLCHDSLYFSWTSNDLSRRGERRDWFGLS
jgi:hypothetical protein